MKLSNFCLIYQNKVMHSTIFVSWAKNVLAHFNLFESINDIFLEFFITKIIYRSSPHANIKAPSNFYKVI